jgi:hypothetical protein
MATLCIAYKYDLKTGTPGGINVTNMTIDTSTYLLHSLTRRDHLSTDLSRVNLYVAECGITMNMRCLLMSHGTCCRRLLDEDGSSLLKPVVLKYSYRIRSSASRSGAAFEGWWFLQKLCTIYKSALEVRQDVYSLYG